MKDTCIEELQYAIAGLLENFTLSEVLEALAEHCGIRSEQEVLLSHPRNILCWIRKVLTSPL